jgi:hypothetical protein
VPLDRLTHRLENWKRQLIDLSRRNRLLNYKPTKASTVEVVDEVPQLLKRLPGMDSGCLGGNAWRHASNDVSLMQTRTRGASCGRL